jgi:hypothetical protein
VDVWHALRHRHVRRPRFPEHEFFKTRGRIATPTKA